MIHGTGKKLKELIEPCLDRMQHVRDFLEDIDPSLEYTILPILDPFGPTKADPTMDVSFYTLPVPLP